MLADMASSQIHEHYNVFDGTSNLHMDHIDIAHGEEDEPDLAGWPEKVSRRDVLAAIPPKEFADSLVAVCFINTNNEASTLTGSLCSGLFADILVIVHPPTFRKEASKPIL
jgi:hypothetical protein